MPNAQRIETEPTDLAEELVVEANHLAVASKTTHLLARASDLHLSDPLKAHIAPLAELFRSLKPKLSALKR